MLILLGQLLLCGFLIFWGVYIHNKKRGIDNEIEKKRALFLGAVLVFYVGFPLTLNAVITNKWYWKFPIQSSLSETEWFAFFASYIGNIGTIFFGWLAYWQTELIKQESEKTKQQQIQIDHLKDIVVKYQVCPMVHFGRFSFVAYHKPLRRNLVKREVEQYLFAQYGTMECQPGNSFVVFTIDIRQQGIIPVSACDIEKLTWKISGKEYEIELKGEKRTPFLKNRLTFVIEEPDIDSGNREAFFQAVSDHYTYDSHKLAHYGQSELRIQILFSNEALRKRRYFVTYWIDTRNKNGNTMISVEEPYIRMEEVDEKN